MKKLICLAISIMSFSIFAQSSQTFPGKYISLEKNSYNCGINLVIEHNTATDSLKVVKNLSKDHFEVDTINLGPNFLLTRGFRFETHLSDNEIMKITSKQNLMGRFKVRRTLSLKVKTNRDSNITILNLKVRNKNRTLTHSCTYSKI